MNQILTQSFADITTLSDTFPLLQFLPYSESIDLSSHTWELGKAKECYYETFPTTKYCYIKDFATVRAVIFNMIIAKVYRKVDISKTYPASDIEKSEADSSQIRSTTEGERLSNNYPSIPLSQWREAEPKTKVACPSIELKDTGYLLDKILEKIQDGNYKDLNMVLQRESIPLIRSLVIDAIITDFVKFLERSKGSPFDIEK